MKDKSKEQTFQGGMKMSQPPYTFVPRVSNDDNRGLVLDADGFAIAIIVHPELDVQDGNGQLLAQAPALFREVHRCYQEYLNAYNMGMKQVNATNIISERTHLKAKLETIRARMVTMEDLLLAAGARIVNPDDATSVHGLAKAKTEGQA